MTKTLSTVQTAPVAAHAKERRTRFTSRFWRRFSRHRLAVAGSMLLLLLIFCAVTAPVVSPYEPHRIDVKAIKKPPSADHWLGTDAAGRDVLSRLIYGTRISLSVGLVAAGIAIGIGTFLGLFSGFYGGKIDFWIMRFTDVVMTIPTLIIIITVVAALGPGILNVMVVIGIFGWTGTCRVVRAETLSLREREFIQAARCLGIPTTRIVLRHILPNVMAPIIVAGTFFVAGAILTEAALSFLGIGVQIPTATWGNMLSDAQSLTVLERMPWLWLPPGLMIMLTVLSINFIGDALRDALDPRLSRS
jgi:peptide/nickel transport system permease protein